MMLPVESLGLSAKDWQFLSRPDKYVEACSASKMQLNEASTARQFLTVRDILARLNGSCGEKQRRGVLLADDVGLGKTTVAALVAWVIASAGDGTKCNVRILVPNDVMVRRWVEELRAHVKPLQSCAQDFDAKESRVKQGKVKRLAAGSINVVKHSYAASKENLKCDLLIIDEAHRAKGEYSEFHKELRRQKKNAKRVLILTATPFSIRIEELTRMLTLIGNLDANQSVRAYSRALDELYTGNTARSAEKVAADLVLKAKAAIEKLSHCVIRHGVDDLPLERRAFGEYGDWPIVVPPARMDELELMLRMDRGMRIAKANFTTADLKNTNDARFHVGWRKFDLAHAKLAEVQTLLDPVDGVVVLQNVRRISELRDKSVAHSKIKAVADEALLTISTGEKVVLFCRHHATAQELAVHLGDHLPEAPQESASDREVWRQAWHDVLSPDEFGDKSHAALLAPFINWLCADMIRLQTKKWLGPSVATRVKLAKALKERKARSSFGAETIADAANRLFRALVESGSSLAVLKLASLKGEETRLPGANGTSRVLAICENSNIPAENKYFSHNVQPDTVIKIFNSPFGPDLLVTTDKLSEGVDLHRYCRHLIHYELDPSPIRTVQRNGRIRRVNSWAAVTGQPLRVAYPAFQGTRDYRLVQIMKNRINNFSLLLGGIPEIHVDTISDADESWRTEVIAKAKRELSRKSGLLRAREPGTDPV